MFLILKDATTSRVLVCYAVVLIPPRAHLGHNVTVNTNGFDLRTDAVTCGFTRRGSGLDHETACSGDPDSYMVSWSHARFFH